MCTAFLLKESKNIIRVKSELKCGEIILNLNSVRIKEKCINRGVPFGFVEVCGRR